MASSQKQRNAKTKVLLIEDEPALRDIYATKMRMEGFEVVEAADGVDGFDKAMQLDPAVILLDIVMPIKNGFEVLHDLKTNSKTTAIPVIIMSNLGQDFEIKRGMSLGAVSFLTKANMTPAKIVEEIGRALGLSATRRAAS